MRFTVLDSWRGICALLVALFHLAAYNVAFIKNSYLFVDFFFVLSGFVISHAYMHNLKSTEIAANFLIRRIGRLWPLHLLMLLTYLLFELVKMAFPASSSSAPFTGAKSVESIITNLALIQSMHIHDRLTWNLPSWSISTEFYTYVVFALVCLYFKSHKFAVAVALVIGSVLIVSYCSKVGIDTTYDYGMFRCIYGFFTGNLVYRLRQTIVKSHVEGALFNNCIEIACVFLVFFFVSHADRGYVSLLAPMIFAVTVTIFSFEKGIISKLLSNILFKSLGTWSYSIYMVHVIILSLLRIAARIIERKVGYSFESATGAFAVCYLLLVITVAFFTYNFIEKPGQRIFNELAVKWRTRRESYLQPAEN